jgi:hypothetical protein
MNGLEFLNSAGGAPELFEIRDNKKNSHFLKKIEIRFCFAYSYELVINFQKL